MGIIDFTSTRLNHVKIIRFNFNNKFVKHFKLF